jgi:hypothetical protein|tara:strand:+ start:69 stop:692 length:624 start_codon:yes stop_codon:yes gene_type:complete
MKKISTLLLLLFLTISYSQSDDNDSSVSKSKFYFGVGLGLATPGGDNGEDIKTGVNINFLNLGYRFSETWGATFNLSSSAHISEDDEDIAVGIGYLGIGPMYTVNLSESVYWDIKPQYAFNLNAAFAQDGTVSDDVTLQKGTGFVFGNSLVFGDGGKGFSFSVDLDYMSGKFKEISVLGVTVNIDDISGAEDALTQFKLGVGVRYNF